MVVKSVIGKMAKVLANPRLFWQRYSFDTLSVKDLHGKVFPIVMSAFFAILLFGTSLHFMPEPDWGFGRVLVDCIVKCLMYSLSYFLFSYIEYKICSFYDRGNYTKTSLFVLEVMLPFYLVYSLLAVFPSLIFLAVLFLYSLYVMYFGVVYFLKINDGATAFFILSTIIVVSGIVVSETLHGVIMDMLAVFFE